LIKISLGKVGQKYATVPKIILVEIRKSGQLMKIGIKIEIVTKKIKLAQK